MSASVYDVIEMRRRIRETFGTEPKPGPEPFSPIPQHLVLFEVAVRDEETRRQRRIDALAVGLTSSSRHLIHGIEIKTNRVDLLKELRDPSKAGLGARYCDCWWLAVSTSSILDGRNQVPEEWGILVASDRGLRVLRQATQTPREDSPKFLASVLTASMRSPGFRYAMGYQAGRRSGLAKVKDECRKEYQRGYHHGQVVERAGGAEAYMHAVLGGDD